MTDFEKEQIKKMIEELEKQIRKLKQIPDKAELFYSTQGDIIRGWEYNGKRVYL